MFEICDRVIVDGSVRTSGAPEPTDVHVEHEPLALHPAVAVGTNAAMPNAARDTVKVIFIERGAAIAISGVVTGGNWPRFAVFAI